MFRSIGSVMFTGLAMCFAASCAAPAAETPTTRPVVVVELFTSEGCSSCPPADSVLADLAHPGAVDGVDVVALGLHVDYWNRLGWADPFSSPEFSGRQQNYARILQRDQLYTPQMIVDGSEEFVGSDRGRARAAVSRAAANTKGKISLDLMPVSKETNSVECRISVAGLAANASGEVLVAITEDGLSSDVPRGENAGEKLHHSAVVRSLRKVATIRPGDAPPLSVKTTIELKPTWRLDRLKLAAFVQDPQSGKVLAAAQKSVAASPQQ